MRHWKPAKTLWVAACFVVGEATGIGLSSLYLWGNGVGLSFSWPLTFGQLGTYGHVALATVVFPVAVAELGAQAFDSYSKRRKE